MKECFMGNFMTTMYFLQCDMNKATVSPLNLIMCCLKDSDIIIFPIIKSYILTYNIHLQFGHSIEFSQNISWARES